MVDGHIDAGALYTAALESLRFTVRSCVQCVGIHALRTDRDILSPDAMCNEHTAALDAITDEFGPQGCTQSGRSVYTPPVGPSDPQTLNGGVAATSGDRATRGGR